MRTGSCYSAGVKPLVIDYGAGNLHSVRRAIEKAGFQPEVTDRPSALDGARAVILPGVGAAADTMSNLNARGLAQPLKDYIASGRPFLGVCMGLQALMSYSEEGGRHECLGVIEGRVTRFPPGLKVPQMGWNRVHRIGEHPALDGIADGAYFYFVHSYYVEPVDPGVIAGTTEYGLSFPSLVAADNIVATQFHPEKSGEAGLRIYRNFLDLAARGAIGASATAAN
ncbi:MAG: imidazole glycerol phosphate synthase subunit HisH [Dehalococcoidia bacterium]|nr:imidazole glycerol phosphate synthase subunit HisH [Dehalococcoidia bacterium]